MDLEKSDCQPYDEGEKEMSKYLRYIIRNTEPLRIANNASSQSGQTDTLRYIPGSTVRGYVISEFLKRGIFESNKNSLLRSGIRFLNVYPYRNKRELIPSLKGFYEDKTDVQGKKVLQNVVVTPDLNKGWKRAALGRYCYLEDDCIYYYQVETGSDLKIKINLKEDEKQSVFRNEYLTEGQTFIGYIAVDNEYMLNDVKEAFAGQVILGNARSAGLGKCQVLECEVIDRLPFDTYLPKKDVENEIYMVLLAAGTMRNEEGEYCGLDLKALEEMLGVKDLKIVQCSTSVVSVQGYNRTWGTSVPSVNMYDAGSVFKLSFVGTLKREKLLAVCDRGIGCRTNEGYGRVMFLDKEYERVLNKQAGIDETERLLEGKTLTKEDQQVLFVAAKSYYRNQIREASNRYIVNHQLKRAAVSNSQLGVLESFTTGYKYDPTEAKHAIGDYIEHAKEKQETQNIQKEKRSIAYMEQFCERIFSTELDELLEVKTKDRDSVMGIPKKQLLSEEELGLLKLELITDMIRYENKKGEK